MARNGREMSGKNGNEMSKEASIANIHAFLHDIQFVLNPNSEAGNIQLVFVRSINAGTQNNMPPIANWWQFCGQIIDDQLDCNSIADVQPNALQFGGHRLWSYIAGLCELNWMCFVCGQSSVGSNCQTYSYVVSFWGYAIAKYWPL